MLAGTEAPVTEIALSVGFQTQSHFTTVFKRFTGRLPLAWRQSHGQYAPTAASNHLARAA